MGQVVDTQKDLRQATTPTTGPTVRVKPRPGRLRRREAVWAYIFMAPAILGILFFSLGPMVASFFLSFTSYDMMSAPKWVGTQNFTDLASDPIFLKSLRVTLTYSVISVPAIMILAFLLALALNAKIKTMKFYVSAYYLPS